MWLWNFNPSPTCLSSSIMISPLATTNYPCCPQSPRRDTSHSSESQHGFLDSTMRCETPSVSTLPCPRPMTTSTSTSTPSPSPTRPSRPTPNTEFQCHHADCLRRFARKTSLTNHLKAHNNHRSRSIYRTKRARLRAAALHAAALSSSTSALPESSPLPFPSKKHPSGASASTNFLPANTLPPRPPTSQVNPTHVYPLHYSIQLPSSSLPQPTPTISAITPSTAMPPVHPPNSLSVNYVSQNTSNLPVRPVASFSPPQNIQIAPSDALMHESHSFFPDCPDELLSNANWPNFPSPITSSGADLSLPFLSPRSFEQDQVTSLAALDLLLGPEISSFPSNFHQNMLPSFSPVSRPASHSNHVAASNPVHADLSDLPAYSLPREASTSLHNLYTFYPNEQHSNVPVQSQSVEQSDGPPSPDHTYPASVETEAHSVDNLHPSQICAITGIEENGHRALSQSESPDDNELSFSPNVETDNDDSDRFREASQLPDTDLLTTYDILPDLNFD